MTQRMLAVALCALLLGAKTSPDLSGVTKEQWRKDVKYFAEQLVKRHKNAFHFTTQEQFNRAIADLTAAIPDLESYQIVVRLMEITASIGDGHTGVHLPASFTLYPVALYWFGDELRVVAATTDAKEALGAKVVKIGGVPIEEVADRVKRVISRNENEWYELGTGAAHIARPEILQALGIVPSLQAATFTLENDDGKRFDLSLTPIELQPDMRAKMKSASATAPVSRQHPADALWFTLLPDGKTVYVNFRRYDTIERDCKALFKFLDANKATRLVIDLRQNGGGDFKEGRHSLVERVKRRPEINAKGHLYVLVGRRTFSAALANAVDFRKDTQAILVGEPIGERPNSYSENDEMTLPNSKLVISYSTRYYKFVDEDVPAVIPDVRIDPTWPDFKAGRDAALEWVLANVLSFRAPAEGPTIPAWTRSGSSSPQSRRSPRLR
jgi:hypothetical protein